ncbi:MAG TPA: nuclease [Brevundimonas sp.]|uniref:thermonuclease family protein n=1 Tax=Brevundimonas sp. TaxID=1871086 RepID=UPI002DF70A21|nr:nuclease [Brevundimonas sp.]
MVAAVLLFGLAQRESDGRGAVQPVALQDAGATFMCRTASVTDGDTLRCEDGTRIRLHAISARERDDTCAPDHPCAPASAAASTARLETLVGNQVLTCRATGRSHRRVTAICWNAAGTEVNCAMVRSGMAVVWERFNARAPICSGARPPAATAR